MCLVTRQQIDGTQINRKSFSSKHNNNELTDIDFMQDGAMEQ
jgi:hypothetical protein